MEKQIREFKPEIACLWSEEKAKELKERVKDLDVKVFSGMDGLIAAATEPKAQIVVTAVVGMIGIRPTIAAMEAGKILPWQVRKRLDYSRSYYRCLWQKKPELRSFRRF